jgi:hypothetical protein
MYSQGVCLLTLQACLGRSRSKLSLALGELSAPLKRLLMLRQERFDSSGH